MVDWYYIFSILALGVYPYSPDIYNGVEFYHLFLLSQISFYLHPPARRESRGVRRKHSNRDRVPCRVSVKKQSASHRKARGARRKG